MPRVIRSAVEIREYVRTMIHEDADVKHDNATITVPPPQRNAPAQDGSNWHMDYFGRDVRRYIALIDGIVREAQAKFNLPE